MPKKALNILKYICAVLLTAVLVYLAIRGIDWDTFADAFLQTKWVFVGMSLACAFAALVFRMERWRLLMIKINPEIQRRTLWDACNIGNLVSLGVPWVSFLVRCGVVTDKKTSYDKTLGTFLMERAWDFLMVFLLIALALILNSKEISDWFIDNIALKAAGRFNFGVIGVLSALCIIVVLSIVLVYKLKTKNGAAAKISSWLDGIFEGFKTFKKVEKKIPFVLYTIFIWTSYFLMCWFIFKAIPALSHLGINDAIFISAVGNLSSLLPVPGGFGSFHYFVALALSSVYGVSWEIGILFATLIHETRSLMLVALGAVSMISTQKKIKL